LKYSGRNQEVYRENPHVYTGIGRKSRSMKGSAGLSGGTFARDSFIALAVSLILVFIPSCKKKETPINKEVSLPAVGNRAPSFMLKDDRGKNVSLSDSKGKVVVIDFWTTWCAWCKETTVELEKLHNNSKDRDVVFLGISRDSGSNPQKKVRDFAQINGLTYLMLIDDGSASKSYQVNKLPTTYVLDRDHIIKEILPGYLPSLGQRIAETIEKSL
jgi:cytochrome c biogenesis protein CcmG, thiol:disulfide interchange protein DsbE